MKKKYMYISDFAIKRLKELDLVIIKKNFIEINDASQKIIDIDLIEEIKNIPDLVDENQKIVNKLNPDETKEMISTFTEKLLKKKLSDFLYEPKNAKELIVFSISLLLKEIYEENHEDLIIEDISGFNPIYHKKKCDLIIVKKFLKKYKLILKRFILYEEISFINEVETRNKVISKKDKKNMVENYNSMLKLCENYNYELKNLTLSIPDFKRFDKETWDNRKNKTIEKFCKRIRRRIKSNNF